ncbi:hypothetical protein Tco_0576792 [Tanacetum coccineum]
MAEMVYKDQGRLGLLVRLPTLTTNTAQVIWTAIKERRPSRRTPMEFEVGDRLISQGLNLEGVRTIRWRNPTMATASNGDASEFDVGLGSGVDRGYFGDGVGSGDG